MQTSKIRIIMPLEVMVRRGHSIAKITNMMLRGSAPLVGPGARMGDHRSPAPGVDGISNHQTITIRLPSAVSSRA